MERLKGLLIHFLGPTVATPSTWVPEPQYVNEYFKELEDDPSFDS